LGVAIFSPWREELLNSRRKQTLQVSFLLGDAEKSRCCATAA